MSTPAWVPVALNVREASAALGMPGRTLRWHLKNRRIVGNQFDPDYPWSIPTSEVERVAEVLGRTPDWHALANLADPPLGAHERENET